jgi:signal transduction histidine kinase
MSLRETLQGQSRSLVIFEAAVLAVLIGWIDYLTGWEWSLFIFYAIPITLVVLKSGQRLGFVFAVLSAIIWWLAQIQSNPYHTYSGFAVAVLSRLFYFAVLVIAVAAVEARRELDRARIASLERAQDLERQILRTSEQEQQRIGRDLHDSLGPHLAAIGYAVTFLENDLKKRGQPEVVAKVEKIRELVGEAVSLTRSLARGIFPVQMDSSGLATALDDLAATTSNLTGVAVTFCENGETNVPDSEAAMHLYRIAQEAVNNATKHGKAKNISIALSTGAGTTRLVIADDGEGMSHLEPETPGIGLHSMKYRARSLHGELKINSDPSEGTLVICEIPNRQLEPATPSL